MATCMGTTFVRRDCYNKDSGLFTLQVMRILNKTNWKIGDFAEMKSISNMSRRDGIKY